MKGTFKENEKGNYEFRYTAEQMDRLANKLLNAYLDILLKRELKEIDKK